MNGFLDSVEVFVRRATAGMAWNNWVILFSTVSIPLVMVILFLIEWRRSKKPKLNLKVLKCEHYSPKEFPPKIIIEAELHIEHVDGPTTEVKGITWNDVGWWQLGFVKTSDIAGGTGSPESDIILRDGNYWIVNTAFKLDRDVVTVGEDKKIEGIIKLRATRGCAVSKKAVSIPSKTG